MILGKPDLSAAVPTSSPLVGIADVSKGDVAASPETPGFLQRFASTVGPHLEGIKKGAISGAEVGAGLGLLEGPVVMAALAAVGGAGGAVYGLVKSVHETGSRPVVPKM